jgi:oligoribonuclease NrnB/cAMP/cGMP phosphodiesterase (DHH superfamily)
MKYTNRENKDNIILNTLLYLELKDVRYKDEAIKDMTNLSKYYTIPLHKKNKGQKIYPCLKNFISNKQGYITTLPELYSSLYFSNI